ncbi:hypothetical protein D4764_03G0001730 [Takifugu flavidus]|uniref:Uncharacterized protein n=1 Tax=Takifugu flavidus TaxID=433684 RepID=A0A5C6N7S5_9TELE|nr:hypothetical protein D4764_03G0001730 [Takifugu flavidus]
MAEADPRTRYFVRRALHITGAVPQRLFVRIPRVGSGGDRKASRSRPVMSSDGTGDPPQGSGLCRSLKPQEDPGRASVLWLFIRDLRSNLISSVEPGAFLGLAALKRLPRRHPAQSGSTDKYSCHLVEFGARPESETGPDGTEPDALPHIQREQRRSSANSARRPRPGRRCF